MAEPAPTPAPAVDKGTPAERLYKDWTFSFIGDAILKQAIDLARVDGQFAHNFQTFRPFTGTYCAPPRFMLGELGIEKTPTAFVSALHVLDVYTGALYLAQGEFAHEYRMALEATVGKDSGKFLPAEHGRARGLKMSQKSMLMRFREHAMELYKLAMQAHEDELTYVCETYQFQAHCVDAIEKHAKEGDAANEQERPVPSADEFDRPLWKVDVLRLLLEHWLHRWVACFEMTYYKLLVVKEKLHALTAIFRGDSGRPRKLLDDIVQGSFACEGSMKQRGVASVMWRVHLGENPRGVITRRITVPMPHELTQTQIEEQNVNAVELRRIAREANEVLEKKLLEEREKLPPLKEQEEAAPAEEPEAAPAAPPAPSEPEEEEAQPPPEPQAWVKKLEADAAGGEEEGVLV